VLNSQPPPPREDVPLARPVAQFDAVSAPAGEDRGEFLVLTSARVTVWVDIAAVTVFVVGLDVLASLVASVVAASIGWPADTSENALQRALFLPLIAFRTVIVVVGVMALLRHRGQSTRSIGLAPPGLAMDILLGIGGMTVAYILIFVWQMMMLLVWQDFWNEMEENAGRIMSVVPKLHPLAFLPVSLAVGVYEEVLFRGFLMTRLRRAFGSWIVAVLITTALFTFLHSFTQTKAVLMPITILSLVFSVTTIWRRSIVPAIVGHFLFDWCAFLYLHFQAGDTWE